MKKLSFFLLIFFLEAYRHIGSIVISIILIIVGAIWSDVCLYIGLFLIVSNVIVALVGAIRALRMRKCLSDENPAFKDAMEKLMDDPHSFISDAMEEYDEKKQLHGEELLTLSDEDLFETVYFQNIDIADDAEDEDAELDAFVGARRTVYVLNLFDMEIQNGGLCQFFVNSSRAAAPYVSEALAAVGAAEHGELFARFITSNHIDVTDLDSFKIRSSRGYIKQTKRFDFDTFDDAYYELPPLQEKVVAYIKENIHEF